MSFPWPSLCVLIWAGLCSRAQLSRRPALSPPPLRHAALVAKAPARGLGSKCWLATAIPRRRNRSRSHLRSLAPSRCAGALLGTYRRDTGGKSGRRPGRHLQVEASGPGNAAGVQQRLAGRFRGGEIAQGRACAVRAEVGALLASYDSGPAIRCVTSAHPPVTPKGCLLPQTTHFSSGCAVSGGSLVELSLADQDARVHIGPCRAHTTVALK